MILEIVVFENGLKQLDFLSFLVKLNLKNNNGCYF